MERGLPTKIQGEEYSTPSDNGGKPAKFSLTANGNRVNLTGNDNGLDVNNWNDNANDNIGVASARNFQSSN